MAREEPTIALRLGSKKWGFRAVGSPVRSAHFLFLGNNMLENAPTSAFVVKVASRCNINCTYCYMYNLADSTWKAQPKFMSIETFERMLHRIRDHIRTHSLPRIDFILHGGEPLLVGARKLDLYFSSFWRILSDTGIKPVLGLQTNGLLLDDSIGEVLAKHGATFGVSIDGIPGKGDRHRVDKHGVPTGARLEVALRKFLSGPYAKTFSGFLGVVDITQDPIETFEYLRSFNPPSIDFRLPLDHHDRQPCRRRAPAEAEYGRWYTRLFDYVVERKIDTRIRFFNGIVQSLTQHPFASRSMGNLELGVTVVETDGTYELVDSLKATFEGASKTSLNVFENSLDEVIRYRASWLAKTGAMKSCAQCEACPFYQFCQGGFYVHRYSEARRFDNVDVYCSDLKHIFRHVHQRLSA